jgi:hypothetical protein
MSCSKFSEIIVVVDFEVSNGLSGLERDVFLNIVEFLDLSTIRKV